MSHKSRSGNSNPGHRVKLHAHGADQVRQHVCAEAARIMAEEGVSDFHSAKRKAAARLGLPETKHLPSNEEVHQALQQHLRLFHATRTSQDGQRLRQLAAEAMRFLAKFEPRLVGPVLSGAVTPGAEIQLHLTADTPEEVGFWLDEHGISHELTERRLRFGDDRHEVFPAYRFTADNAVVELSIFTQRQAREAPLSPVDSKPMKRANLKEVEMLLASGPSAPLVFDAS